MLKLDVYLDKNPDIYKEFATYIVEKMIFNTHG